MSLLREIQKALMNEASDLGPILLKLRYFVSKLGSEELEEWVKHEAEGYPADADLPGYRIIGVSYAGTFSGAFGSGINNAPIPSYSIEKYGGEGWVNYELRQSVASIDSLISKDEQSGTLTINAANLILLLQGNIYKDMACNSVVGTISKASLVEIQNAVRNRIMELTIKLEETFPDTHSITLDSDAQSQIKSDPETVKEITQQIIYGDVTSIHNSGDFAKISMSIEKGNQNSLVQQLVQAGLPESDAKEFSEIIASEKPESAEQPFGEDAKAWLKTNICKALDGTWKMGVAAATKLLEEAVLRYYGLK